MTQIKKILEEKKSGLPEGWKIWVLWDYLKIYSWKTRPKETWIFPVYGWNWILDYWNNFNQENETIIIWRVWAYCWSIYFENRKFWLSDNALGVKNNEKSDIKYLYYFLKNKNLNRNAIWWAQPLLTQKIIKDLEVKFPPLPTQKSIAKTLSSFDEKIELLREQNETLEKIGQEVFKEWFGGYKVWDLEKAENVFEFEKWIEPWSKNYSEDRNIFQNPIRFFRVWDISENWKNAKIYTEKDLLKNKYFETKDILVSFDWTVWRVFVWSNWWYSSWIRKIFPKKDFNFIKNSFVYFYMKSWEVQNMIDLYSEWTTIQHASKSIRYLEIISDKEKIFKVQEKINPIFEKILVNLEQIETLSKTRDELLPRLMKGEVLV